MPLKQTVSVHPGGSERCPLCKELISREASKCPHCTADLSENEDWQKIQNSAPSQAGCSMILLAVGILFAADLIASFLA